MNFGLGWTFWTFWRTKRLANTWRTRAEVTRWQQRRLARYVGRTIRRVPYYAGSTAIVVGDLPLMDKATVNADFERLNTAGVTLAQAQAALERGDDRVGGLIVGQSTGTTGNRGVFVLSEAERFTWLGLILAKTMPDFPWARHTVAIVLPGYGLLYASAAETGRLTIRFFDVALGVERWRDELRAYGADTIVAPPKVLRALAEGGGLRPAHVFSGAEVLDPIDRRIIEEAFALTVREIYMATEGLFGVACERGVLHLAEDAVAFEWEAVPASRGLVVPIVTDFTRSTQIMARYRMNDLLQLSDAPCACGSPLQAVTSVLGRQDDVFLLPATAGVGVVMVTPDVIRNAIVDADRRILDFRVVQTAADRVEVVLATGAGADMARAAALNLERALDKAGARASGIEVKFGIEVPVDRKLRRVRRNWQPPQA